MTGDKRVEGSKRARQTTLERAEVRAEAYQFIREHPNTTTHEVAKKFNVASKHAYNWIRHCQEGKQDKLTKTLSKGVERALKKEITELTFDQAAEAMIYAFEQARRVPTLEERIYRLENILAATKNELENLQEYQRQRHDQANRFRLAQQQGEVKTELCF